MIEGMKPARLIQVLRELMKNSKLSDRQLAKLLDVSQPTITRSRRELEREGYVKSYTVVPNFGKLGYQILAFTFSRMKHYPSLKDVQDIMMRATKWVEERPNIIFAADGEGLGGKDIIMISFHRDYPAYADFMRTYALEWGEMVMTFESFIVSIGSGFKMKPLDLKYLAFDE